MAAPARAQDEEPLAARYTKGKRVKQRGSLARLRGMKVSIAGRRTMTAGDLADGVFGEQAELTKELQGAKDALLGDPEVTEEIVETDEAMVITSSTKITVVDPDGLRRKSKRFGKMRGKRGREGFALRSLKPAERKEFEAFKARMMKLPPRHPLRKAADAGDDALLDAVIDGQGDMTVTTTVVVPKAGIKRTANGKLLVRRVDADGEIDLSRTVELDSGVGMIEGTVAGPVVDEEPPAPSTREKGKTTYAAKFLTGFTEADDFIWEKRWDFSFGFISVKFHPWYEFGLRVPIEIKGTMTPASMVTKGQNDVAQDFQVELSARAMDADAAFYREVGLAADKIKDGKEFLLGAGLELIVRVKVGWIADKKWVIPQNAQFDWGADFEPPFGDCGSSCGKDFWLDAKITRTELSLLKIVTGSARVGFKLAGEGDIRVDYEALYGDGTVKSWPAGRKGQAKNQHTLTFDGRGDVQRLQAEAEANDRAGVTKHFGYRLSDPKYDWKLVVTPGVRGDIDIKAKPLLSDHFTIGPLWLEPFAITLGTLHLERHQGTKGAYKLKHGDKTWTEK